MGDVFKDFAEKYNQVVTELRGNRGCLNKPSGFGMAAFDDLGRIMKQATHGSVEERAIQAQYAVLTQYQEAYAENLHPALPFEIQKQTLLDLVQSFTAANGQHAEAVGSSSNGSEIHAGSRNGTSAASLHSDIPGISYLETYNQLVGMMGEWKRAGQEPKAKEYEPLLDQLKFRKNRPTAELSPKLGALWHRIDTYINDFRQQERGAPALPPRMELEEFARPCHEWTTEYDPYPRHPAVVLPAVRQVLDLIQPRSLAPVTRTTVSSLNQQGRAALENDLQIKFAREAGLNRGDITLSVDESTRFAGGIVRIELSDRGKADAAHASEVAAYRRMILKCEKMGTFEVSQSRVWPENSKAAHSTIQAKTPEREWVRIPVGDQFPVAFRAGDALDLIAGLNQGLSEGNKLNPEAYKAYMTETALRVAPTTSMAAIS